VPSSSDRAPQDAHSVGPPMAHSAGWVRVIDGRTAATFVPSALRPAFDSSGDDPCRFNPVFRCAAPMACAIQTQGRRSRRGLARGHLQRSLVVCWHLPTALCNRIGFCRVDPLRHVIQACIWAARSWCRRFLRTLRGRRRIYPASPWSALQEVKDPYRHDNRVVPVACRPR